MSNIIQQLNTLIKTAKESKVDALKGQTKTAGISADLDHLDDHTKPATTGAQAAANHAAAKESYPTPANDVGASPSETGASVTESTEGATATSTSGSEGGQGAELAIKKDADNGEEKPENKVAAARALAIELRKTAEARLSSFDRWLIKQAKDSAHPLVKKAMEAADDEAMAGAAADVLMEAINSGQLSEEDAVQIIEEAVAEGAVSEEDLAGADMGMEGGAPDMGMGVPAEAMVADAGPEGAVAEEEAVAPDGAVMDETMVAKLAAAKEEQHLAKLASDYSDYVAAGYGLGVKIAEAFLAKKAEDAEPTEEEASASVSTDEGKVEESAEVEESPKEEVVEESAEAQAPAKGEGEVALAEMMGIPAPASPEEQAALAMVEQELGLSPQDTEALMAAPVPQMDKIASYKARCRAALLSKIALHQ